MEQFIDSLTGQITLIASAIVALGKIINIIFSKITLAKTRENKRIKDAVKSAIEEMTK